MRISHLPQWSALCCLVSLIFLTGCAPFGGSSSSGSLQRATATTMATPAPTATPDPNRPFTGPASFTDAMTTDTGFWEQSLTPSVSRCFTAFDGYHMLGYSPYQAVCGLTHDNHWANFALQVQMTMVSAHQGTTAGFIFRFQGSGYRAATSSTQYYGFDFRQDGFYGLFLRLSQTNVRTIASGTAANFHHGNNAMNLIGLVANKQHFAIYLNGTLLATGTDSTWTTGGFGVETVSAAPGTRDEVLFQNFQEWNF